MQKTKKARSKTADATIYFVCSPKDVPTGGLTRSLFGMSIAEVAAEISANRDGKWDAVYEMNT